MNYWELIFVRLDDRNENRTGDEIGGVTQVSFGKAKSDMPGEQDNIHTKDQIVLS